MKKIFTILLIVFTLSFKAQLILTHTFNSPVVGDIFNYADWDSTSALSRATGLNKVWDYTSIISTTDAITNTTFTTPSFVPGLTTAFPSANLISFSAPTNSTTDYIVYNITTNNDAEIGGYQPSGSPPTTTLSNTYYEFNYPFAYGNNNTFSVSYTSGTGTNQATFVSNGTVNATGAGTVMLPGGVTLNNCLQLKTTAVLTSSLLGISFTVNTVAYQYFSSTQKFAVISISNNTTTSSLGPPSIDYDIHVNTSVVAGIRENTIDNSFLSIYPNPAKDVLNLQIKKNIQHASYQVEDISGRVLKESSFNSTESIL